MWYNDVISSAFMRRRDVLSYAREEFFHAQASEILGTHPKNRRVLAIFRLQSRFAAAAALKRRGGGGAATFRWCGYDWRGSLYLGLVSAEAKAAYSVHLWYVVSAGPSKTSERAQPGPKPPLTTTPLNPHSLFEIEVWGHPKNPLFYCKSHSHLAYQEPF